jgi:hypothetical protein
MYATVLLLHSWIRWAALALGVVTTFAAFTDRGSGESGGADRVSLLFMMTLDVQMLVGLVLYLVLSPITATAFKDFGAAMRDPALRFWTVEHASMMALAVILVHVGRVLGKTARTPESRRLRQLVCFGLATVAMLAATPWPGMANGRPLFRV